MNKKEASLINKITGVNKEIVIELLDDNAPEIITNKDYPQHLKNGLLVLHLAIKTLTYKSVSSVYFSLSHVITSTYDSVSRESIDTQTYDVTGEICFENRSKLMDYKKPSTAPSNADRRFRSYSFQEGYRKFTEKLESKIISLPSVDYYSSGKIPPEYQTMKISLSHNHFNQDFLRCIDNNSYFFSVLLKEKLNERMDKTFLDKNEPEELGTILKL